MARKSEGNTGKALTIGRDVQDDYNAPEAQSRRETSAAAWNRPNVRRLTRPPRSPWVRQRLLSRKEAADAAAVFLSPLLDEPGKA
jgi:hypothetical protein